MPNNGFVRVKLCQFDKGQLQPATEGGIFDPYISVNIKEAVSNAQGEIVQYIQKKKTIYPEWNTTFDAHWYEGRIIQFVLCERPDQKLADVKVAVKSLVERCRGQTTSVASMWLDLKPSGRLLVQVRYFSEEEGTYMFEYLALPF
jgi:novel protein kinase C delta type